VAAPGSSLCCAFCVVDVRTEPATASPSSGITADHHFHSHQSLSEEGYWRGLIIDASACWSRWLAILYSSAFSAVNHLWLMIVMVAARNPAVAAYQFVLGLMMGVVYLETRCLRWPIAAHALVNLLSLTVTMFLNLYVSGPPICKDAAQMPTVGVPLLYS